MAMLVSMSRGGGRILDRLKGILGRSRDLTPLIAPVRNVFLEGNRDRSLKGLDWQGKAYAKLKPSTIKDRVSKGYAPGPPMNREGLNSRLITGYVIQVEPRDGQLRFLSHYDIPWIEYHITGVDSRYGRGKLPKRDPLGWNSADLTRARALLPRHVLGRPI